MKVLFAAYMNAKIDKKQETPISIQIEVKNFKYIYMIYSVPVETN